MDSRTGLADSRPAARAASTMKEPMAQLAYLNPGKREQTKQANRVAILDAAREVFSEMGFEAATVRDIIRRTGLSVGAFYNYFRSKEEAFDALSDDGAMRFRPILEAQSAKATDFESYLRAAVRAYFDFIAAEQQVGGRTARPAPPDPTRGTRPKFSPSTSRFDACSPMSWTGVSLRRSSWITWRPVASRSPAKSEMSCLNARRPRSRRRLNSWSN